METLKELEEMKELSEAIKKCLQVKKPLTKEYLQRLAKESRN